MPLLQRDLFEPPSTLIRVDGQDYIVLNDRSVLVTYQRHRQSRRYRIYLKPDGSPRVTIPWSGSLKRARAFVFEHRNWLVDRVQGWHDRLAANAWKAGGTILWRGQPVPLETGSEDGKWFARVGTMTCPLSGPDGDLREQLKKQLLRVARQELPARVQELAGAGNIFPSRVRVGDQTSRWGSASKKGTICLNWRLLQLPEEVRDYIIWHELMHLKEMNHSPRFWALVASVCPAYQEHRRWLRVHHTRLQ